MDRDQERKDSGQPRRKIEGGLATADVGTVDIGFR